MLFQWTRRHRGSWDQWTRFMWQTSWSWMKRTIRNGDEYHFDKRNKISVKKRNHKLLILVFLGLLMAYLKRHRLRSYFKTNNCFIIIWVKTGNNHAFFAKLNKLFNYSQIYENRTSGLLEATHLKLTQLKYILPRNSALTYGSLKVTLFLVPDE